MKLHTRRTHRDGYVIFAVLIVIVVLSLVAYRFTDSMTSEYTSSTRAADAAQAKLAAVSGLHYAAAVLSDRNTFNTELNGNPYDNPDIFEQFQVQTATSGTASRNTYFSIRCVAMIDSGTYEQKFGVIDEGGKLNINSLIAIDTSGNTLYNALMQLPNMTADIADAIVDWVDTDDDARTSGAESSYYQSLPNPYQAKNGPLNSLDELLLVKGMTPYLLYGGDTNRNGVQDEGEVDGTRGWADFLTVYGRELNVDSTGTARIYLNGDDLSTMYQQLQNAVGNDLATYIIASKVMNPTPVSKTNNSGSSGTTTTVTLDADKDAVVGTTSGSTGTGGGAPNQPATVTATTDQLAQALQPILQANASSGQRIRSVMSLIGTQITLPRPPGTPASTPNYVIPSPLNDPSQLPTLLPQLMDKTTVQQSVEMVPRLNVNTAPMEVLMGLPNVTSDMATAIVTNRANLSPTDQGTVSAAWLITSNTLTSAQYQQLEKFITGTTMVYRVQSIGYLDSGGPMARMEAVIDTNQGSPRFLYMRDLSDIENPRGFQPQTTTQ